MLQDILLRTKPGESLLDITGDIQAAVEESGVREGICIVAVPHTTAGVTINSGLDENTLRDITEEMDRIIPTRVDFHHQYDTPRDASGHIKSVIIGSNLSLIVTEGRLLLGFSQSVLFCEFDGPRNRKVWLRIIEE